MKSLTGLFVCLVLSQTALANNPLRHFCIIKGGQVVDVNLPSPSTDQVMLCQFGAALIGAESLLNLVSKTPSQSITAYQNGAQAPSEGCADSGGEEVQGTTLENQSVVFCSFSDGTHIGLDTLKSGPNSSENSALNQALAP